MKRLDELYNRVRQEFQLKQDSIFTILSSFNPVTYEKITLSGKDIHLLGEMHYSIMPVIYLHKNIIPLLAKKPSDWIIFREDMYNPGCKEKNEMMAPTHYYVKEVSKLLNIPVISALTDIKSAETISYLENKLSCNIDLDVILCYEYFNRLPYSHTTTKGCFKVDRINIISQLLNIDKKEVMKKLDFPNPQVSLKDIVVYWNELSRNRFMKILDELDASKILVSVGALHMNAFK